MIKLAVVAVLAAAGIGAGVAASAASNPQAPREGSLCGPARADGAYVIQHGTCVFVRR